MLPTRPPGSYSHGGIAETSRRRGKEPGGSQEGPGVGEENLGGKVQEIDYFKK